MNHYGISFERFLNVPCCAELLGVDQSTASRRVPNAPPRIYFYYSEGSTSIIVSLTTGSFIFVFSPPVPHQLFESVFPCGGDNSSTLSGYGIDRKLCFVSLSMYLHSPRFSL